jgi:hypothetical protein
VVAPQLSEDADVTVGLLELGPSDAAEPRALYIRRWSQCDVLSRRLTTIMPVDNRRHTTGSYGVFRVGSLAHRTEANGNRKGDVMESTVTATKNAWVLTDADAEIAAVGDCCGIFCCGTTCCGANCCAGR